MTCPSCSSLKQHILEHEILGVGTSSGGDPSNFTVIDGYLTYMDTSRGGKRLSTSRLQFGAVKKDKAQDVFLRVNSSVASSKSTYRMIHNGTITGISIQVSSSAVCKFHIYRNNLLVPLTTLDVAGAGAHLSTLNVDFAESDILQFYIEGTCNNPVAWIEVAWRF